MQENFLTRISRLLRKVSRLLSNTFNRQRVVTHLSQSHSKKVRLHATRHTPFSATFVSLSCTFDLYGRSTSLVVGSIHSFLGPSRPQSEVNSEIMKLEL